MNVFLHWLSSYFAVILPLRNSACRPERILTRLLCWISLEQPLSHLNLFGSGGITHTGRGNVYGTDTAIGHKQDTVGTTRMSFSTVFAVHPTDVSILRPSIRIPLLPLQRLMANERSDTNGKVTCPDHEHMVAMITCSLPPACSTSLAMASPDLSTEIVPLRIPGFQLLGLAREARRLAAS